MYLGHITGIVFLPISIIIFLNVFGVTSIDSILGASILLIASIGIILIQIGDVIGSHTEKKQIAVSYVMGLVLMLPTFLYFASLLVTLPSAINNALPTILASFLFVEGVSSFYFG
ncbi:MAG: hypothetical protein AABX04_02280 [Nanoarchaeota archaeon]